MGKSAAKEIETEQIESERIEAKPFLKWVGGKRQLLPELRETLRGLKWKHYYEPFLGGGALFFALRSWGWGGPATLADSNELLIRSFLGVRNDVEAVIEDLQTYRYSEEEYYRERQRYSLMIDPIKDDVEAAAWLIYMNRTGFNGLFRVSRSGKYNVPFGRYENPRICDAEGLRAASVALRSTTILMRDFEHAVTSAEKGDLVYFDPPYVPRNLTSDFTAYTADGFTAYDHQRLRDCAYRLKRRGVHVVLSNSDVPLVRAMYGEGKFSIREVSARRNVNSKPDRRGAVNELIIT